jgi:hypothetical protein
MAVKELQFYLSDINFPLHYDTRANFKQTSQHFKGARKCLDNVVLEHQRLNNKHDI